MIGQIQKNQLWFSSIIRWVLKFWLEIEIKGLENLNNLEKPFILASNHQSLIDPFLITSHLPKKFLPVRWAAHRYFFEHWYKFFFEALGAFPIAPKTARDDLNKAVNLLKQGYVVGFFPEGKLSPEKNKLLPVKEGVNILQRKSCVLIAPVIIFDIFPLFRDYKKIIHWPVGRKKIKIIFGQPFTGRISGQLEKLLKEAEK